MNNLTARPNTHHSLRKPVARIEPALWKPSQALHTNAHGNNSGTLYRGSSSPLFPGRCTSHSLLLRNIEHRPGNRLIHG